MILLSRMLCDLKYQGHLHHSLGWACDRFGSGLVWAHNRLGSDLVWAHNRLGSGLVQARDQLGSGFVGASAFTSAIWARL